MRLAERVERAILAGNPTTLAGRAKLKAAIRARQLLVRLGDPTVRYRVGAAELELPLSHELPFYQHDHPQYDRQLGAIAAELGGPVVDVGANVGDSAAAIRARSPRCRSSASRATTTFFALLERNARALGGARARARARRGAGPAAGSERRGDRTRRRGRTTRFRSQAARPDPRRAPALLEAGADQARHRRDGRADPAREPPAARASFGRCSSSSTTRTSAPRPRLRAPPRDRLRDRGLYENTGELVATRRAPVRDLHAGYVGHGGARYADVCVRPR